MACRVSHLNVLNLPCGLQSNTFGNGLDQSLEPPCSWLSCGHPLHCSFYAACAWHTRSFVVVSPERMGCLHDDVGFLLRSSEEIMIYFNYCIKEADIQDSLDETADREGCHHHRGFV